MMINTETPRILIVRLSALGDVIQTLPLLSVIREQYPNAFIGWLVDKSAYPLLKDHPLIDRIHVTDKRQWREDARSILSINCVIRNVWEVVQSVKKNHYDVSLDTQGLLFSAILPFLARIPKRVGFAEAREKADKFYTEKLERTTPEFDPDTPFYEQLWQLAQTVGCSKRDLAYPMPMVHKSERHRVSRLLQQFEKEKPLIALAPFTKWTTKDWPVEHWARLITKTLEETNANLVIVGGNPDNMRAESILEQVSHSHLLRRVINGCGLFNFRELQAVFEKADLMIGGDSFPTHLAGAVNHSPIVALYGPTSHIRTGPARIQNGLPIVTHTLRNELECVPCHKKSCAIGTLDCLHHITPDAVFASVSEMLAQRSAISHTPLD